MIDPSPSVSSAMNGSDAERRIAAASAHGKLRQAAQQFESYFIAQALREMRQSVREIGPDDSPLRDDHTAAMFDYIDTQLADQLSHSNAFGIADFLVRQLRPTLNEGSTANLGASNI